MSNRSRVISAVSGLATLGALFVSGSASAARIEGFQARASVAADQHCVINYWTGVSNSCSYTMDVQAAATVPSAGNYSTNSYAYGYNGSTILQTWSVGSDFNVISSTGPLSHTLGSYSAPSWSTFTSSSIYVPSGGALLFNLTLASNQIVSYFTY